MFVFLLILLLLFIFSPYIGRFIQRLIQRRMINYIRKAAGFPPEDKTSRRSSYSNRNSENRGYSGRKGAVKSSINEYAEDVEFVEIKDEIKVEDTYVASDESLESYDDGQVSDAEWEEIK